MEKWQIMVPSLVVVTTVVVGFSILYTNATICLAPNSDSVILLYFEESFMVVFNMLHTNATIRMTPNCDGVVLRLYFFSRF